MTSGLLPSTHAREVFMTIARCSRVGLLAGLVLVCAVGFARAQDVTITPGTDFAKYKTYKWVQVEGWTPAAPADERTISNNARPASRMERIVMVIETFS
jgi:hypothetical protein